MCTPASQPMSTHSCGLQVLGPRALVIGKRLDELPGMDAGLHDPLQTEIDAVPTHTASPHCITPLLPLAGAQIG